MLHLVGAVLLSCGLLACVAGVRTFRRARAFSRSAHRAAGTVVGIHEHHRYDSDGPTLLRFPIVRFETGDGRVIETTTVYGASIALAKVGEPVLIRYDPDDPHVAQLERSAGAGPVIAAVEIGLGTAFCLAGLLVLAVARSLEQLRGI